MRGGSNKRERPPEIECNREAIRRRRGTEGRQKCPKFNAIHSCQIKPPQDMLQRIRAAAKQGRCQDSRPVETSEIRADKDKADDNKDNGEREQVRCLDSRPVELMEGCRSTLSIGGGGALPQKLPAPTMDTSSSSASRVDRRPAAPSTRRAFTSQLRAKADEQGQQAAKRRRLADNTVSNDQHKPKPKPANSSGSKLRGLPGERGSPFHNLRQVRIHKGEVHAINNILKAGRQPEG